MASLPPYSAPYFSNTPSAVLHLLLFCCILCCKPKLNLPLSPNLPCPWLPLYRWILLDETHVQRHTDIQKQRYTQTHTTQKHRGIHKHANTEIHMYILMDSVLTLCFLFLFSGILPLSSKWPHQLSPFVPLFIVSLPSLESNVHHYNYSIDTISNISRGSPSCS